VKCLALISVCFAAVALIGCGGGSSDPGPQLDEIVWRNGEPAVVVHPGPVPKKLIVKDLREGTGAVLTKGSIGSFKYKSFDYRTGQQYEDWWDDPFRTSFGEGASLGAWETGLKGMRVGGRRVLIVPPKQAYGHVPVVYVLELIAVVSPPGQAATSPEPPSWKVKGTGPKPKLRYPSEPPRHVVVRVLREGSGPRLRPGDSLAARYVGGNAKTKFVQDFWSEENPYRFGLGQNRLGKAWEIGLNGMRLGGRRELIVPSRLAYGDGMMVYVIEPLEIEKREKSGT
jgi:peptidylprolyl isomerase